MEIRSLFTTCSYLGQAGSLHLAAVGDSTIRGSGFLLCPRRRDREYLEGWTYNLEDERPNHSGTHDDRCRQ